MAGKLRFRGGDKLTAFLKKAPREATEEVRRTIRTRAQELTEAVRAAAPAPPGKSGEGTGALRNAIRFRLRQKGLSAQVGIFNVKPQQKAAVAVGLMRGRGLGKRQAAKVASQLARDPFYARFIEYGTRHAAAQPFLWPAFRAKRRAIRAAIIQATVKGLKKAVR